MQVPGRYQRYAKWVRQAWMQPGHFTYLDSLVVSWMLCTYKKCPGRINSLNGMQASAANVHMDSIAGHWAGRTEAKPLSGWPSPPSICKIAVPSLCVPDTFWTSVLIYRIVWDPLSFHKKSVATVERQADNAVYGNLRHAYMHVCLCEDFCH